MATIPYTADPSRTVLGVIRTYCAAHSLPIPASVDGTNDAGVIQLREILQEVGDYCVRNGSWDFSLRDVTWASTGIENQGSLASRAPDGFIDIADGTFWDISSERPIYGPVGDQEWTVRKRRAASIDSIYRVYLQQIQIWPVIPAGRTLGFTYKSNHWLSGPTSNTSRSVIVEEADHILLPKDLILAGIDFYWRRAKELPYSVEEGRFFEILASKMSSGPNAPVLRMDGEFRDPRPGIVVPQGNWLQL